MDEEPGREKEVRAEERRENQLGPAPKRKKMQKHAIRKFLADPPIELLCAQTKRSNNSYTCSPQQSKGETSAKRTGCNLQQLPSATVRLVDEPSQLGNRLQQLQSHIVLTDEPKQLGEHPNSKNRTESFTEELS